MGCNQNWIHLFVESQLVNLNLTRDRTLEQKGREALALVEVEKKRALQRQATLNNSSLVPVPAQAKDKGRTRDIVAEKVGFKSGHEAERSIKTVKKIDELELIYTK